MNPGADDRIVSPILSHPPSQNATVDRRTPVRLGPIFRTGCFAGSHPTRPEN